MVTYMRSECDPLDIGFRYFCILCLVGNNIKEYRPDMQRGFLIMFFFNPI